MTLLPLSRRQPIGFALFSRFATLNLRAKALWLAAFSRMRGRLRPIEWILLFVGTLALLAFVYVLWRQPVSRR